MLPLSFWLSLPPVCPPGSGVTVTRSASDSACSPLSFWAVHLKESSPPLPGVNVATPWALEESSTVAPSTWLIVSVAESICRCVSHVRVTDVPACTATESAARETAIFDDAEGFVVEVNVE